MRLVDSIVHPAKKPRRKFITPSAACDTNRDGFDPQAHRQTADLVSVIAANDDAVPEFFVPRHSSAYVAQFIHQQVMEPGRHVAPHPELAKKYQSANENAIIPKIAKISV